MSGGGQRTTFDVPPELTSLLLDFTVNVLLNQPKGDLIEYAANYFQQLLQEKKNGNATNTSSRSPNDSSIDDHMTEDDEEISMFILSLHRSQNCLTFLPIPVTCHFAESLTIPLYFFLISLQKSYSKPLLLFQ